MYPQHFHVCAHVVILSLLHVPTTLPCCMSPQCVLHFFCRCNMSLQHDPSCLRTFAFKVNGLWIKIKPQNFCQPGVKQTHLAKEVITFYYMALSQQERLLPQKSIWSSQHTVTFSVLAFRRGNGYGVKRSTAKMKNNT